MSVHVKLGLARVKNHTGIFELEKKLKTKVYCHMDRYRLLSMKFGWSILQYYSIGLCYKICLALLEWDGKNESQLQIFDESNSEFMEYLEVSLKSVKN